MLLNLFQGIDSSTAGLLKPKRFFDINLKTAQARSFKNSQHGRAFIHLFSILQKQVWNLFLKVNEICILFKLVKFLILSAYLISVKTDYNRCAKL